MENRVEIDGELVTIHLQDGSSTMTDLDVLVRLKGYRAMRTSHGYVKVRPLGTHRGVHEPYLHRFAIQAPPGSTVDHVNRDRLDNRKANLRLVSQRQNVLNQGHLRRSNTSGFRGVSWFKPTGTWRSTIKVNRRQINLGYFKDPVEAARAYDEAAKLHHGDFATLNFSDGS